MEHTTHDEIDNLLRALAIHWSPQKPHGHTAGKASSYLKQIRVLLDRGKPLGPKSSALIRAVRSALSSDKWDELESVMRGWW